MSIPASQFIPLSILTWLLLWMFLTASVPFSSVAQSCPTLCDPMNCSTPGLPVHHQLREFTQTHVHRVSDAIQPSHPMSSPSPSAPNPSQHQTLFQWVSLIKKKKKKKLCRAELRNKFLLVFLEGEKANALCTWRKRCSCGVKYSIGFCVLSGKRNVF